MLIPPCAPRLTAGTPGGATAPDLLARTGDGVLRQPRPVAQDMTDFDAAIAAVDCHPLSDPGVYLGVGLGALLARLR